VSDEVWLLMHHQRGRTVWRCERDRDMRRALCDAVMEAATNGQKVSRVEMDPGDYALFVEECRASLIGWRGTAIAEMLTPIRYIGPTGELVVEALA
jgi:hypothetical protein